MRTYQISSSSNSRYASQSLLCKVLVHVFACIILCSCTDSSIVCVCFCGKLWDLRSMSLPQEKRTVSYIYTNKVVGIYYIHVSYKFYKYRYGAMHGA